MVDHPGGIPVSPTSPVASPLRGNLENLPPTLIQASDSEMLLDYCNQKGDVVLGIGILGLKNKAFRIAHMGHVNAPMMLGTLSVIEMGLVALNIPHGRGGVGAAIEYLGKQVS